MPQDFVSIAEESQNISTVQPACRVRGCKGDPDFVLAYSCRTGFLICSPGMKVNIARTKKQWTLPSGRPVLCVQQIRRVARQFAIWKCNPKSPFCSMYKFMLTPTQNPSGRFTPFIHFVRPLGRSGALRPFGPL